MVDAAGLVDVDAEALAPGSSSASTSTPGSAVVDCAAKPRDTAPSPCRVDPLPSLLPLAPLHKKWAPRAHFELPKCGERRVADRLVPSTARSARRSASTSSTIVTGPSFTSSTSIRGAEDAGLDRHAERAERGAEPLVERLGELRPRRVRRSSGGCPCAVSAISVNCETTSAAPPVSSSERSNLPSVALEDPQARDLAGEPLGGRRVVASRDAEQHAEARRRSRRRASTRARETRWTTARNRRSLELADPRRVLLARRAASSSRACSGRSPRPRGPASRARGRARSGRSRRSARARARRGTRPRPRPSGGCGSTRSRAPRGSRPCPARAASPSRAATVACARHPAPQPPSALLEEVVRLGQRCLRAVAPTSSRIAAAIARLRRLRRRAARRRAPTSTTSFSARVEADVGARDVVEDDEVGVLRRRASRRLRSSPSSPCSAPKTTSTWPGRFALAERAGDVGGRLELDRPRLVALRALAGERLGRAGSRRRRRRAARRRRRRARARRRASPRRSASGSSRRRPGPAPRGSRRAGRPRRRAGGPPRRARRPSAPTSGCRRSGPRRAARACRRR